MQLTMFEQSVANPRPPVSGKTSQASSPTKATRLAASSAPWWANPKNSNRQGANGRTLVVCMDPREQSHGGFWMPNISAWPNAAAVCSLSQVLEQGSIPSKYFLSEKALAGIARRDGRRSSHFILLSRLKGHALSMTERHMYWSPPVFDELLRLNGRDA